MSILIGLILLGLGASFGYILCAILSFDRNYINEFEFTTSDDGEKRPNYLMKYGDGKMITVYYRKEFSWLQIRALRLLFGVDVKKLYYDVEEENKDE
jgi:hypothetical protein